MFDFAAKVDSFVGDFGERARFPFPVADLAEHKEFTVLVFQPTSDELAKVLGAIIYERNVIYVNGGDAPARQRFTIAHELGHLALHRDGGSIVDFRENFSSQPDDPKEREANAFAAELLMPEKSFRKEYQKPKSFAGLLAAKFRVSVAAVNIRIKTLGLAA